MARVLYKVARHNPKEAQRRVGIDIDGGVKAIFCCAAADVVAVDILMMPFMR